MGHRTVPLEIGRHVEGEEWSEKIMTVADFCDEFLLPSAQSIELAR